MDARARAWNECECPATQEGALDCGPSALIRGHRNGGSRVRNGVGNWPVFCWLLVWLGFWSHGIARAEESISIFPAPLQLFGEGSEHRFLLQRVVDDRVHASIGSEGLELKSSNTNVFRVETGRLMAIGDGVAALSARLGDLECAVEVRVSGVGGRLVGVFRNQVQPVLARFGCNSGACHGAAAGQNGFRLSLRGYDDEGDHAVLTRQAQGRRVSIREPERSLILLKSTGAVPHKGGKKFGDDSLEYRVLSDWIAQGASGPKQDDPRINGIEVFPARVFLDMGGRQPLVVVATFSDGHVEDVTAWTKFTSANERVATVVEDGMVQVSGYGEGAVTAWYRSQLAAATITVPFTNRLDPVVFDKADRRNFVDELVLAKLRTLNLPPSPRCNDPDFIRRAFLDTIGVLPTSQETREFLVDESKDKRDRLIEKLLGRPEFVDYWSYKWSDLLLVQSKRLRPAAMWSFYQWIRQNVAANTAWDVMARQIVTAQGSTLENGAANFFVLHNDPKLIAETTSQAFLGMSINCARCHNHPMEKWTNDEYFGFANLFSRVRSKTGAVDGDNLVFASASGDLVQPLRGKPQSPKPLEGRAISLDDPGDRRATLADWLVSPDNAYFSRAIVNRIWANFFSVGLVERVDDLRLTNPASNEELLVATAGFLSEKRFDLKAVMRLILQSETYQRSGEPLRDNIGDTRYYSRYYPRRLSAEVLLDALSQVTGAPTKFTGYPDGWRAMQLPDSNVESYFLKSFGRADRDRTCECERSSEPSIAQVLHLANGDIVNQKLSASTNRITQQISGKASMDAILDEAYLTALSRHPTDREKVKLREILAVDGVAHEGPSRAAVEDIYWALVTSKEFLFNR